MGPNPGDYSERTYGERILKLNLKIFNLTVRETYLFISTDFDLTDAALCSVYQHRSYIEAYVEAPPDFLTSLATMEYDELAPSIIRDMSAAARKAAVGPVSAVADAVA